MAVNPPIQTSAYPFRRLGPAANITPFTQRDGGSFLELLERLSFFVDDTLRTEFHDTMDRVIAEFNEAIDTAETFHANIISAARDYVDAEVLENREFVAAASAASTLYVNQQIAATRTYADNAVQAINNRVGNEQIQRVTLSEPYTLTIDPVWPNAHPILFMLTQDVVGGHGVVIGANITGSLEVAMGARALTEFSLKPVGNGTWNIIQTNNMLDKYRIGADAAVALGIVPRASLEFPPNVSNLPSVRSGSVAAPAAGGAGYAVNDEIVLAGGVNTIPMRLRVTALASGGAVGAVTTIHGGLYTVLPVGNVGVQSTTGAGAGATFTVSWTRTPTTLAVVDVNAHAANTAPFRFTGNGPRNVNGSGGWGNTVGSATAQIWEWETDADYCELRFIEFNSQFSLYVDNRRINMDSVVTGSAAGFHLYGVKFPAKAMRRYRLFIVNSAFIGIVVPPNNVVQAPTTAKPFAWALGDSYAFGNGASNVSTAALNLMAEQLGLDLLPDGVGGSGYTGGTSGDAAARLTAKLTPLTREPAYLFFDMGYNNAGSVPGAAFTTAFDTAITTAKQIKPSAKIIVFGPATPQGVTPNLIAVRDIIRERCIFHNVAFVDQTNWLNMGNEALYVTADNIHPNQLGHSYLGALKAEYVRPLL